MSKFGLDENDVRRIVGEELQKKTNENQSGWDIALSSDLRRVNKEVKSLKTKVDNMNNQSGWDRALSSDLRRLNKEIEGLKSRVDMLEARINKG
tara:strand:+ start:1885 stop:2166 length:282 start_codon:yes stop_codon:yes gene_type:complete